MSQGVAGQKLRHRGKRQETLFTEKQSHEELRLEGEVTRGNLQRELQPKSGRGQEKE